jgi:hypothetical protein
MKEAPGRGMGRYGTSDLGSAPSGCCADPATSALHAAVHRPGRTTLYADHSQESGERRIGEGPWQESFRES